MDCSIDWPVVKSMDFEKWKYELYCETEKVLKNTGMPELSSYNELGYYHNVKNPGRYAQAKETWTKDKKAISERICAGSYPGIWTSMFHPCNTHNLVEKPNVIMFTFRNNFFIYDRQNPAHREIAVSWDPQGMENPWEQARDRWGWNFARKMELSQYPSHKSFYEDNNIGAVIGYSDYMSPVIILEEAIEKVEFLG